MLSTPERSVLLRVLGGEHRRLASAPLRLLSKLKEATQLRVLATVRTHVLLVNGLPLRAKLVPCLSTLES